MRHLQVVPVVVEALRVVSKVGYMGWEARDYNQSGIILNKDSKEGVGKL